ncbi:PREDICTED: cation channel sperm-associated protein 2-like [Acropora digitifera]|uniref:cation channel sperm-associated protein 2-like n=1 Tax=Acropora digitifera TaxID=70779 RepID=UPI00077B1EB6|nr:PREDICTED: cation channel sperm-associated protein 2-like [Acropora digitifera]
MSDETPDELSHRAEIFRSKLIEDFQLIDIIANRGDTEPPKYYSNEVTDDDVMKQLLRETPQGLIKFQMYSSSKKDEQRFKDRRLNRIKNKNTIPLGPWAHTVVEDPRIQNFMMILIITNSIVLGVQAEISKLKDSSLDGLKLCLQIFDICTLTIFVLEIIVKWIDGFWTFWKNGWNIFDFLVTLAHIDLLFFQSMAFILILLMTLMYIFAVAGTVMFASFSKSNRTDLTYKQSFSTLGNALVTLFQLFTLDHWYDILRDLIKVSNPIAVEVYIILWLCIGAFIFRNIFVGIMVMNFQTIRNDFNQQVKEQAEALEAEQMRAHLEEEMERQDRIYSKSRRSSSVGAELFQERGAVRKRVQAMGALAEEEESGEEIGTGRDKITSDSESKQTPNGNMTTDPLAALGDKLAKLR